MTAAHLHVKKKKCEKEKVAENEKARKTRNGINNDRKANNKEINTKIKQYRIKSKTNSVSVIMHELIHTFI